MVEDQFARDFHKCEELVRQLTILHENNQDGLNSQIKYLTRAKVYDLKQHVNQFERLMHHYEMGSYHEQSAFKGATPVSEKEKKRRI